MDKYEFNMSAERLRKHYRNGEYEAAMKIADTIDWRRVTNVSLLTMVSEVYEKNRDYAEAKDILLLAYEKAPAGKRLLYKLTILSLKENNIPEAEAYYKEFYDVGKDDSRHYILRYLILKAKGASLEQQINALEAYNKVELDEMWMYELAELYYEAGRYDECVEVCDNIMLMFGIGSYVDKAIDLKKNRIGCELTPYQQSLVVNRDKYEENLLSIDTEYTEEQEERESISAQVAEMAGTVSDHGDEPAATRIFKGVKASPAESMPKAAAAEPVYYEAEIEHREDVTVGQAIEAMKKEEAAEDAEAAPAPVQPEKNAEAAPETKAETKEAAPAYTVNFIVERRTPKAGLDAAVRLLKLMHEHTGSTNQVTKIRAEKLNERGIFASSDKIAGKDLIIEEAGDLAYARIEEVIQLIRQQPTERVIVLIDNPMQLKKIISAYPELLDLFHVDKEENTAVPVPEVPGRAKNVKEEKQAERQHAEGQPKVKKEAVSEDTDIYDSEPEDAPAAAAYVKEPEHAEEEMDIDEFAAYAGEYAKSIDCSISGKSLLALYERVELMEEDGIPLTKENAVSLIERAADKAEKKTLGSLFSQKYDKNDMLILKEEHFF